MQHIFCFPVFCLSLRDLIDTQDVKCKGNVQIETVENELDVSLTKREHKREKSGS